MSGEVVTRHGAPVPPVILVGVGLLFLGLIPVLARQSPSPEIARDPATPRVRIVAFAYVAGLGLAFIVTAWAQGRNLGAW